MRHALLALALLAGCASAPPDAAHLETRAELGEARVVRVDGKMILAASGIELAPGRHRLTVYCGFNAGMMIGDAQHATNDIEVTMAARQRYVLEARMSPRPCSLALIDADTGRAIATPD